jgi:hypothetical protein
MSTPTKDLAEAFSRHRFRDTYDHLATDVVWLSVGGPTIRGREAVVRSCESTLVELTDTTTDFTRFRSVADTDTAAVDVIGHYTSDDGETSVVASCDIYEFDGDTIVKITSYTVELDADDRE